MGAPKLSDEEVQAIARPLEVGVTPVCKVCGHVTFPAAWCECDPRRQIEAQLIAEAEECGVLLRWSEEDERNIPL